MISRSTAVLVVSISTIRRAERALHACEQCERTVDTPFHRVLAQVTGTSDAEYFLSEPAHCPGCAGPVFENTLVEVA